MSNESSQPITPESDSKSPKVMYISKISQIQEKLNFLAQSLNSEEQAEKDKIYIELFPSTKEDGSINIIRFSTRNGVYTEVNTVDKYKGDVLEKNIAVNLFDLYNVVSFCDETISFWIDEDSNELVVNSYYDAVTDIDELEVRLPILEDGFTTNFNIPEQTDRPDTHVHLKPVDMYSIIKETNILNTTEYVRFVVRNNKLFIAATDPTNGVDVVLYLKSLDKKSFEKELDQYIPISILKLIAGSGEMFGLDFNFHKDFMFVETNAYTFSYRYDLSKNVNRKPLPEFSADFKEAFIVDSGTFILHLNLLNKINVMKDSIKIEKLNAKTIDLGIEHKGRYSISSRMNLAMLTDKEIFIDGHLFYDMFDKTGLDAFKFSISDDTIYSKLENAVIVKELFYNHSKYTRKK